MSRPVKKDERIDFFLSHSWHDDNALKWKELCKVVEAFKKKNGRGPTLWLDKVCIDQTAIADGLRVLPVNVVACDKMLVMWGETYPTRLWCIWEIFTLSAFMREEQLADRLEVVPFGGDGVEAKDPVTQVANFNVRDARCYDPNELAKLRTVIGAVGEGKFNDGIRKLAVPIKAQMDAAAKLAGSGGGGLLKSLTSGLSRSTKKA